MGVTYQNKQTRYLNITFFLFLIFMVMIAAGINSTSILMVFILTFLLLKRCSLTVRINGKHLEIIYGIGIVRRKILLEDIEGFSATSHPWYYLFWAGGVRWDVHVVSGNDAVIVKIKEDKKQQYRSVLFLANSQYIHIGTNDRENLVQMIERSLSR